MACLLIVENCGAIELPAGPTEIQYPWEAKYSFWEMLKPSAFNSPELSPRPEAERSESVAEPVIGRVVNLGAMYASDCALACSIALYTDT